MKNYCKESKRYIPIEPTKKDFGFYFTYIKSVLLDLVYRVFFLFYYKKERSTKYKLCFCSIFKNEAPYIKEWIEYHLLMGVEHFYLYNNNSTDNYMEVLQPYIDKGIVTFNDWPEIPGQISMYKHWYATYRNETQWCGFPDLDEFFCLRTEINLQEWLKKFKKYPLVLVYWKMFGSSGILEHNNDKLVIEQYTNCWAKLANRGKLFYNTSYDIDYFKADMMHYFLCRYKGIKIPPINQFYKFVVGSVTPRFKNKSDIQCNHYWSKAYNNYEKKHSRGSAVYGKSWKTFDKFVQFEQNNISSDFTIQRFLIQMKLKIANKYPTAKDDKYQ